MLCEKKCADELIQIGFDGFGFGGWPLNDQNELVVDILKYTAELMPDDLPKYAMGLGRPEGILECYNMGYRLFDCVIPTREARHGRLYVKDEDFYHFYYINDEKYRRDQRPVSEQCGCFCCQNYSRAYLQHLFKAGDSLGYGLATIHNLYFYTEFMKELEGLD